MNHRLTPDGQTVEPCKILNLVVRRDDGSLDHRQFLSVVQFDYGELLETVREQGFIKSDEVMQELSKLMIERKYVLPADAYVLDIGASGRVSEAVQELYRHNLNPNHSFIKNIAKELKRAYFEFQGPEGTVHLLSTDNERVLGHAHISIGDGDGLYETLSLDIVAPIGSDLPERFESVVQVTIFEYLADNHPDVIDWQLTVKISMSELSQSMETLGTLPPPVRRPCHSDWISRL